MSLGGGQQSGGVLTSQVSPYGAYLASAYQNQAAQQASNAYTSSVNQAMQQLNGQYQTAIQALMPTTVTGIQALDQLNQYLGLNPYNPGNAPTAPVSPTVGNAAAANYILQNSDLVNMGTGDVPGNTGKATWVYTGLGGEGTAAGNNIGGYLTAGSPGVAGSDAAGQAAYYNGTPTTPETGVYGYGYNNPLANDQALLSSVNKALSAQELADPTSTLSQQAAQAQQNYQNQMQLYNAAQQYAQQYGTPLTSDQITQNITNQPGYQAQLNSGVDAIQRAASASGQLGSSSLLANLMNYGQNQMSTYYNNTLNRLAGLASAGQQSATQLGNTTTNQGSSIASLLSNIGTNQANSALAQGNAMANAATTANTNYNILGQQSTSNLGGLGSLLGGAASLGSTLSGLFS